MRSDHDHLSASFNGRQSVQIIIINTVLLALAVVAWLRQWVPQAMIALLVALLLVGVVLAIRDAIRRRRAGTVIKLDGDGITVTGSPTIRWADVREISVTRLSPRWLTAGRALDAVVILPRDGVSMPDPPTHLDRPRPSRVTQRGREQRLRQYGTNLVLMPYLMTASADQITSVARQRAGVPVMRLPTPRKWLLIFLLAPLLVLGALLVPVIVALVG